MSAEQEPQLKINNHVWLNAFIKTKFNLKFIVENLRPTYEEKAGGAGVGNPAEAVFVLFHRLLYHTYAARLEEICLTQPQALLVLNRAKQFYFLAVEKQDILGSQV